MAATPTSISMRRRCRWIIWSWLVALRQTVEAVAEAQLRELVAQRCRCDALVVDVAALNA